MQDNGIAKGLSDSELAQCVQGQGAIPGWQALGELQQRNKLRSSAPVQAPQGTVAQSVVAKALSQAGLNPQPQQTQQPQAGITAQAQAPQQPQGGITAQPQQSMAKGGILHLDGGTTPDNQQYQDYSSQYVPQGNPTITPNQVQYHPGYTPDATSLSAAGQQINPMYGQTPNYQGQMDQLQAANTKAQAPQNSTARLITNLVGNIAANPGNPYQGWGKGLLANQDENDKLRQQNFANSLKTVEGTSKITDDQQKRAQAMANTTASYAEHQQALSDSQAQMKLAADTHNAQMGQQAQQETFANNAALANDRRQFAEDQGDPKKLLGFIADANARGDKSAAGLATDALNTANAQTNAQEQKLSDIREAADLREKRQQQAFEMAKQSQQQGFEMGKQKQAQQFQSGLDSGSQLPVGQRFGDPDFMAGVARGEIAINPRDKDYKQISDQIKTLDPTWTGDRFANRQKYMQNLTSGPIGKTVTSMNNTLSHMGELEDQSKTTGLNLAGTYSQAGNALSEAAKTAGTEIATTLKGSQATQGEVNDHIGGFTGRTQGNRQAAINEDYKLLGGRIRSIAQQHSAATGEAFPVDQYLDGEAVSRLQAHGVDPYKIANDEAPTWMKSKTTPVAGIAPNKQVPQGPQGQNPNPTGYTVGHRYGNLTYKGGDVNQRSSWE